MWFLRVVSLHVWSGTLVSNRHTVESCMMLFHPNPPFLPARGVSFVVCVIIACCAQKQPVCMMWKPDSRSNRVIVCLGGTKKKNSTVARCRSQQLDLDTFTNVKTPLLKMKIQLEKWLCSTWNFHYTCPRDFVLIIHVGLKVFSSVVCIGTKSWEKTITRNIVH